VGLTSALFADRHPTPLGVLSGIAIHANELLSILSGRSLHFAAPGLVFVFSWILGTVILAFFLFQGLWIGILAFVLAFFGAFLGTQTLFARDYILEPFILLLGPFLGLVTGVISTFLTGITLISADTSNGVLKSLNWSDGYDSSGGWKQNIFVGVYEIGDFVTGNDDYTYTVKYTDSTCTESFCDTCSSGMGAVIAFVAIFFIASVPSLVSAYLRYSGTANTALMRWVGVAFNIICVLAGCLGMIIFAAGCQAKVVSYFKNYSLTWSYGPSFGMLAASTVFKFVEVVLCFLIGTEGPAAASNQA